MQFLDNLLRRTPAPHETRVVMSEAIASTDRLNRALDDAIRTCQPDSQAERETGHDAGTRHHDR